ncbi:MAG: aminotransferase class III-fold pyridoxal phosphate-dependent enzyme, partial [Candidatus Omnitrophica bacterium]|nr:aminotransferase class III-fold pyridoxal phosphate-dependent enzyme [Candidatus Omnitrophota bacterium]
MGFDKSRNLHRRFTQSAPCDPWPEGIPPPHFFMRGSGSHVWDADGNEYIDYILGMGPLILGHSPATVIEAVTRQLQDGLLFATPTDLEIEVAESLKALVPCAEKVRFGTSGSEAVHAALRLARAATGRPRILRFEGHYHGWLDNIAWEGAGGNGGGALKPSAAKGQIRSDSEGLLILPWNDLEAVGDLFRRKGSSIAAVILEPVMASCGAIPPTNGFLAGLHELCARHGSVLIFDEVVTGFRLALGGAQEFFGVTPDLAVFGKALGAGIPISAVAGGERVMRHWGEASPILAGTHSANPVSLAAARATLETLSADGGKLLLGMRETAAQLRSGLEALREQTSLPLTIRGVGPLLNVSFVPRDSSPITDHRSYLQTDFALTARLFDSLRARGVHVGHDGRWFLSSTHTDEDIQRTLAAMQSSLEELGAESTSSIRRPRGGGAFDGNGQAHKALALYEELVVSQSKDVSLLFQLAWLYAQEGRLKDAEGIFLRIGSLKGRDASLLTQVGRELLFLGNAKKSREFFDASLKLNPKQAEAWFWLAEAYYSDLKKEEALQAYASVVPLLEKKHRTQAQHQMYLKSRGRMDLNPQMIDLYEQALRQYPADRDLRTDYLDLLIEAHQHDRVTKIFSQFAKDFPLETDRLWPYQVRLAFDQKNFKQALYYLDRILKKNPNQWAYRRDRAECLYRLGKWREARKEYETLFKVTQNDLGIAPFLDDIHRRYDHRLKQQLGFQHLGEDQILWLASSYQGYVHEHLKLSGSFRWGFYDLDRLSINEQTYTGEAALMWDQTFWQTRLGLLFGFSD